MGMISRFIFCFCLVASASLWAGDVDEAIALARGFLGGEKALKAIETIHYSGRILDGKGQDKGRIDLYLKKPDRQRIEIRSEKGLDVTAVNGYEGYVMKKDGRGNRLGLRVLPAAQVKRLLINAVENLYFFRAARQKNGDVRYRGISEKFSQPCHVVYFSYPNGMFYERFFHLENGRLMETRTDNGLTMKEMGFREVGDVKFPERIVAYREDGQVEREIRFDEIRVNEEMPEDLFDFPR